MYIFTSQQLKELKPDNGLFSLAKINDLLARGCHQDVRLKREWDGSGYSWMCRGQGKFAVGVSPSDAYDFWSAKVH